MIRRAQLHVRRAAARRPEGPRRRRARQGRPAARCVGLIAPTERSPTTGEELEIDGVRIVFQVTPGHRGAGRDELLLPRPPARCAWPRTAARNLHNLYTPRGAQVRDALAWSHYIDEAIELFGRQADAVFASHHWPQPGGADGVELPAHAARPLPLPARPDAAPRQPRPDRRSRSPRSSTLPDGARERVLRPRLLRHGQPQREGRLPALPRLVRRQPGPPAPAPAGRGRASLRRVHGRRGRGARAGPRVVRRRRLPLGGRGGEPRRVRRARQRRGARSCRPTRWSSSATSPSPARGAAST